MQDRVYRIDYLLHSRHDEPMREHYKCAVNAENYAEAFERGWKHITRCIRTENYRQIDYAGMSWDAHPRDMQDYLNAHYSEAGSSMKIYGEKPYKSPEYRFTMSSEGKNELMHMSWGGKIKTEVIASELKDIMKLYPPACFLELEWAEKAVSELEKNSDFEMAARLKTLVGNAKEWDDQAIKDLHTLVKYGDIDMPDGFTMRLYGCFPPQSWNLDSGLVLYKPDGEEYNPELSKISDSFFELLQQGKMQELKNLIEDTADIRLFQSYVGSAIRHEGGEEIERLLIDKLQKLDGGTLSGLIYHYGLSRDDKMLSKIIDKAEYMAMSSNHAMEKCMLNNDFATAGFLLRTKAASFDDFADYVSMHKKFNDNLKGFDDFMSRLQKYNNDVVLKAQSRDASPSVGKIL